jgi:superfamily II DNA helicase RecQ
LDACSHLSVGLSRLTPRHSVRLESLTYDPTRQVAPAMAYRFFQIPVRDSGAAEEELNRFLRGHRVLSVERRWVDLGLESYWSFCVDYLERPASSSPGSPARAPGEPRGKVDYREVLSPEQFAAFVKLRALRQSISKEEAVPVYVIFTNEQLAAMVQQGAASKADLGRIDGVGEARIQKYGDRFLACMKEHRDGAHEASRTPDGTGARP